MAIFTLNFTFSLTFFLFCTLFLQTSGAEAGASSSKRFRGVFSLQQQLVVQQEGVKIPSSFEPQKPLRVKVMKGGKGGGGRGFAAGGVGGHARAGKTSAAVPSSQILYSLLVACSFLSSVTLFL